MKSSENLWNFYDKERIMHFKQNSWKKLYMWWNHEETLQSMKNTENQWLITTIMKKLTDNRNTSKTNAFWQKMRKFLKFNEKHKQSSNCNRNCENHWDSIRNTKNWWIVIKTVGNIDAEWKYKKTTNFNENHERKNAHISCKAQQINYFRKHQEHKLECNT